MADKSDSATLKDAEKSISAEEASILRNHRRRGLIKLLTDERNKLSSLADSILESDKKTKIPKDEAVVQIAEWEKSMDNEPVEKLHLNRINSSLLQQHIPKLEEKGLIEYDRQNSIIKASYQEIGDYTDLVEEIPCKKNPFPRVESKSEPYLTLNHGFEILSNERRQAALQFLEDYDEDSTTASDIADSITSMENEGTFDSNDRKAVYVNLVQSHLPRMDCREVVDYNKDRKTVTEGKYFDHLVEFLPEKIF